MGGLLKLIAKLFGKNAMSKTIGTRTNVIRLPSNKLKKYTKRDLDIESVSLETAQAAKKEMEQLIPEIPKMNDAERLILEGNLRRLDNKLNPPSAEITDIQTKQKVSKEGIRSLEKELGLPSDVDPDSPLGRLMTKTKQIQKQGKDLAKEFGMEEDLKKGLKGLEDAPKTTEEYYEQTRKAIEEPTDLEKKTRASERSRLGQIFDDISRSQISMSKMQDEGLVRATAREIMTRDIKSGKLKIPKEEADVVIEYSSVNDPIDIWRKYYGEDALEQLDSMVPDFYQLETSSQAADLASKKFTFEPKLGRPKGSYTQEEFQEILKKGSDDDTPEFAEGGSVGLPNILGV